MSEEHIKVWTSKYAREDHNKRTYYIQIGDTVILTDSEDGAPYYVYSVQFPYSSLELVYDSQEETIGDPIQPHLFDNLEIPTYTWSDDENTFLDDSSGLPYEVEGFILSLESIVTGHTPLLVDDFKFKLWLTKQIED